MSGLGASLLLLTILATIAGGAILILSLLKARPDRAVRVGAILVAWYAAYIVALIATSLASRDRTLPVGADKHFCGFYLDCHMAVAVERVETRKMLGTPGQEATAGGLFHIVTLRVNSNAKRATLGLHRPQLTVVDGDGKRYERSVSGERALLAQGSLPDLERPVTAGESFTRPIVFDLPEGIREPRLLAQMGAGVDRAIELVLIGDEDSMLHKKTYLAIDGLSAGSASR